MKKLFYIVLLLFGGPDFLAAGTGAFQSWLTLGLAQRFDYGLEAVIEAENHFAAAGPAYRHYEITPELVWHYSPRYDFSLGYEESGTFDSSDNHAAGHQGFVTTTIKLPLKDWSIGSRQRFQFGDEDGGTLLVFRQKTRVQYSGTFLPFRLEPFLSDEWFCDLQGAGITENRAQLGLAWRLNEAVQFEIYGMWLDQWQSSHTGTPVFGINFNLNF